MDEVLGAIGAITLIVVCAMGAILIAIHLGVQDLKAVGAAFVFITPAITAISALARGNNKPDIKEP